VGKVSNQAETYMIGADTNVLITIPEVIISTSMLNCVAKIATPGATGKTPYKNA